ncbi:hypothetical protein FQA39_LY11233 [Lamprigera yunnana]|nr:hypothetical protein FQA39_LY11233 [Lamprigera yunnana]
MCNKYKKTIVTKGNTTNFKTHLQRKHPLDYADVLRNKLHTETEVSEFNNADIIDTTEITNIMEPIAEPLKQIIISQEYSFSSTYKEANYQKRILSLHEINILKAAVQILKPIKLMTGNLGGETYVIASAIVPIIEVLRTQILGMQMQSQMEVKDIVNGTKSLIINEIKTVLDNRYTNNTETNKLLQIFTLMDHRFKNRPKCNCHDFYKLILEVYTCGVSPDKTFSKRELQIKVKNINTIKPLITLLKTPNFENNVNCEVPKAKFIEENNQITITTSHFKKMDEPSDMINKLEEDVSNLKLQLNASQRVRATLELQLTQKDELIIKSQTETLRKDQSFKQELKQLKDKLQEIDSNDINIPLKELQETVTSLKLRETKLLEELASQNNNEQNYKKIMDEYKKTVGTQVAELQKLNEEQDILKQHFATLELTFSDVFQKYERCKKIIEGYKSNEDSLCQSLLTSEDNILKSEQKYESLKAHAKAQIEKSNQELLLRRDQYDAELHKLTAIVRRLEIKNASLTDSLEQKSKECTALAALCDEVTGTV